MAVTPTTGKDIQRERERERARDRERDLCIVVALVRYNADNW